MLSAVSQLPHDPGVYRFLGRGERVMYVGRAVDLRRRVASYWGDLRDRRHLRAMVPRIEGVEAVVCDSPHEAAWLERNLLHARRHRWNRTLGEEVPVYVRLDGRPRSPGLAVVHNVNRAAPGGRRPAWSSSVLETLRLVLGRDPDAVRQVREDLARRRDEAARALAFERAGQVQAELEALDWLVSEQKVTTGVPVSQDLAGWADGVLVRFAVRDGRLSSWTQQRCSEATARPYVAATPPAWIAFAQRNAQLAAALAA